MNNAQPAKGEDELVKRLGVAVAKKWNSIPPFAQDEILDQACEIQDGARDVDVREALQSFLEPDQPNGSPLE